MLMMNIIELSGVTKTFGSVKAVDDLSLVGTQREYLWFHRSQWFRENHHHPHDHEDHVSGKR